MSVKPSSPTMFLGVVMLAALFCTPGSKADGLEGSQEAANQESGVVAAPVGSESLVPLSVTTKTVSGQKLFTVRYNKPLVELVGNLEGLATRLAKTQIRAGGEVDGPLHILIESSQEDSEADPKALLAFPTRGNPRSSGRHRSINTGPFFCAYLLYEGPAEGIANVLAEFARDTGRAGHELNGQTRLVFSCDGNCSKEHLAVELQLGIE